MCTSTTEPKRLCYQKTGPHNQPEDEELTIEMDPWVILKIQVVRQGY